MEHCFSNKQGISSIDGIATILDIHSVMGMNNGGVWSVHESSHEEVKEKTTCISRSLKEPNGVIRFLIKAK